MKSMSVTIRKAKKEDSDFLANIFLESRRSAFSWEDPAKFKLEDFYNQTEGEIIFLAEDSHKKILGFISIWEQDSKKRNRNTIIKQLNSMAAPSLEIKMSY